MVPPLDSHFLTLPMLLIELNSEGSNMACRRQEEDEGFESLSLRTGNLQELLLLQQLGLELPSDDARLLVGKP